MTDLGRRRSQVAYVIGGVTVLLAGFLVWRLLGESLAIAGDAAIPMSQGTHVPLDVTFNNGYDLPVSVTGLNVAVQGVSAPNADNVHRCSVADFVVDQASRSVTFTIAARASASLSSLRLPAAEWPTVGFLTRPIDQRGCEGATLTLSYTASKSLQVP